MYKTHKYIFFWIRKFTITFSSNSLHTLCAVWWKPTMPTSRWCHAWKAMSSTPIFLMYIPYPEEVDLAPAPGCVQWMGPQQPNLRDSNWAEGLYHSHIHIYTERLEHQFAQTPFSSPYTLNYNSLFFLTRFSRAGKPRSIAYLSLPFYISSP